MDKFRKAWLIFVGIVIVIFLLYRFNEFRKSDSSGPVFSGGQDSLEVSIQDGEDVLLQGITASDKKDGDVTESILVEELSKLYDSIKRTVTYAAFDSDNHVTEMEREIVYTDYISPRFELTGSLRFRAGETVNVDKIVKAKDCLDGDLSNKVKIEMDTTINNRVTGIYSIVYEVTNSAGDTVRLPIDIEIYQSKGTEVEMNLDRYLVYYEGTDLNYKDYLKSIKFNSVESPFEGVDLNGNSEKKEAAGEETATEQTAGEEGESEQQLDRTTGTKISKSKVTVRSEVDKNTPGIYPVYYYYRDTQGTITYEATEVLYVVVE